MALPDKKTLDIVKRLQNARLNLLRKQPFYALLLMHMKFALDKSCEHSYTDGDRIAFNPEFLDEIDDGELEFVLMHNVLHAALSHPFRVQADYDLEVFDKACDIVVNSNILYSFGGKDLSKITLKKYGVMPHLAPSGKEGYELTLEQVYNELMYAQGKKPKQKGAGKATVSGNVGGNSGEAQGKFDELEIVKEEEQANDQQENSQEEQENHQEEQEDSPSENEQDNENESSGVGGNGKSQKGKSKGKGKGSGHGHGQGKGEKSDVSSLQTNGGGGEKADKYDSLEAIKAAMLAKNQAIAEALIKSGKSLEENKNGEPLQKAELDDHSYWEGDDEDGSENDCWTDRLVTTAEIVRSMGGTGRGTAPLAAERIIEELKNPRLDWRTILNDFVQEEICDYSFAPPDKRMEDCPFFLPDFNEKDESAKNLLFMIDTSGSMGDDAITECYSEIYGAIQQFNGKLQGKLGFFDAVVVEPTPFEDEDEFKIIRPKGGGGTSFHVIFEYVKEEMQDEPPVSIIILTDGYAPFPKIEDTQDIPVLWIINNNEVKPPWGKVARIVKEETKG